MTQSKEIEDFRNKITNFHQTGKDYKGFSKVLKLQKTIVTTIIY